MKAGKTTLILYIIFLWSCNNNEPILYRKSDGLSFIKLHTNNPIINKAFRIAVGDLFTNVQDYQIEIFDTISPVILAGLEYNTPWIRDAAINCWNAGSFIIPEVASNTLLSTIEFKNDSFIIQKDSQYWDAIIWCTGAWSHYLATGNRQFLEIAYEVTRNSIQFFEKTELNKNYHLFRGLGWSDGVAAYDGKYANTGGSSAAFDWPKHNPDKRSKPGFGIPMMATYTNCLYYNAYVVAHKMSKELEKGDSNYKEKAERLKHAINKHLWNKELGLYKFYFDEEEESNIQSAYGNAFAIIFGVAEDKQVESIFKKIYVTPAGVPCGWPPLARYHTDSLTFPRHNAAVWPQIQGFWAQAASMHKKEEILFHELSVLANNAVRDMQFGEIYHPITGELYGGMQEKNGEIALWPAMNRQTWSATAYIRMVLYGLLGIELDENGINFSPCVPKDLNEIVLSNLKYRNMIIQVKVLGAGTNIEKIFIDGKSSVNPTVPNTLRGNHSIEIFVN